MTADSADIRFECNKCGQHLVVESAGAGLTADCPICDTTVTVPAPPSAKKSRRGEPSPGSLRSPFADPLPEDLRDELIDASLINGKLVRDLEKAREEIARLQQQLKVVGDECERLNSSATHTKAELKTFQTQRQQLKAEVSTFRQKFAVAEDALAARGAELNEARAKAAANLALAKTDLLETRLRETERAAEWEARTGEAQKECEKAVRAAGEWEAKAGAAEAALAEMKARVAALDAEINEAARAFQKTQKAAAKFEDRIAALDQSLATERAEREKLTADLAARSADLVSAQARAASVEDDLHKTQGRLGEVESALTAARQEELRLTTEHGEMRRQLEDAKGQMASMADHQAQFAMVDAELAEHREKLWLAEESNQSLAMRCEQLRREADSLRRDVTESQSGRELVETRARLEDAVAERDRTTARLSTAEADLQTATASEATRSAELERTRRERDDAVERAESLRETRAAKDNQVLRGIIARLNGDLSQRTAEVLRAKRARVALKISCVLFGIGLLGVVAFALKVLPQALRH